MGSIPATLEILLNHKNNTSKKYILSNRFNLSDDSHIDFTTNARIDAGTQPKRLLTFKSSPLLTKKTFNFKYSSLKIQTIKPNLYSHRLVHILKSNPLFFNSKTTFTTYTQVQHLQKQIQSKLKIMESTKRHKMTSSTVIDNLEQKNLHLVSFWKKTYPHSLRIVDSLNNTLMVKKSSKIRKPIRQIFLKLKTFEKALPLLNKTLLHNKLTSSTVSPENEMIFMTKTNSTLINKTIQNTATSTLGLLHFFLQKPQTTWTLIDFRQNYLITPYTKNWIWHNSLTSTLLVNQLNTKFNTFFYKNYNLIQQLATTFSAKIFYQNHFFTINRLQTLNQNNITGLSTQPLLTNLTLIKTPTNIKQGFKNTFKLYHRYFLFIEFTKTLSYWTNRRPIYSHLFSKKFLINRFLITITSNSKIIPYWKRIHQTQKSKSLKESGLIPFLLTKDNDNFFENNFDNKVITLILNTTQQTFNVLRNQLYSQLLNFFSENFKLYPQTMTKLNSNFNSQFLTFSKTSNPNSLTMFFQNNTNLAMLKNSNDELLLFNNPLLFKFFFWNTSTNYDIFQKNTLPFLIKNYFKTNSLVTTNPLLKSNLLPLTFFKHTIRRKVIKLVVSSKYLPRTTTYFYRSLIQFMEFYTGKKVYLKFNPFIENSLTYADLARCYMWFGRVNPYQRILGHRIFVHESLRIFHLALRFKDPTFLSNWIKAMLYRMSFWKYRVLFRYIKYVLRNLFWAHFDELDFKGIKLTLRGKISVAGNARTRTLTFSVGKTSHSEMNNRVLSDFTNIHSFTGVMGFRLSFYF